MIRLAAGHADPKGPHAPGVSNLKSRQGIHIAREGPGSLGFQYLPQIITGQKQGLGMVYEAVQAQAAILAFNDIYCLFAIVTVAMIPSFLILRSQTVAGERRVRINPDQSLSVRPRAP
jgi:hypothetical protein